MREILFRGKRIDTGEWVEGYYKKGTVIAGDRAAYIADIILAAPTKPFTDDFRAEVDPATVGQYTGLTDKNGKRIFEGDIFDWGYAGVYDRRYVVTYDAATASFVGMRGGGSVPLNGIAIKIIGNIHDNPELLEVEGNG